MKYVLLFFLVEKSFSGFLSDIHFKEMVQGGLHQNSNHLMSCINSECCRKNKQTNKQRPKAFQSYSNGIDKLQYQV